MPIEKTVEQEKSKKDNWEKADIIMRPVGALITALTIGLVGFFANYYISLYQERDSRYKFLTELESHREDAESALRKDMFNSIIDNILSDKDHSSIDEKILQLELLSYNFHESLNLMPLFEYLNKLNNVENKDDEVKRIDYRNRLIKTADAAIQKQISTLEDLFKPATFYYETDSLKENELLLLWSKIVPLDHEDSLYYESVIMPLKQKERYALHDGNTSYDFQDTVRAANNTYQLRKQSIKIQIVTFDKVNESVTISLNIHTTLKTDKGVNIRLQNPDKHANFTVNHFEFPMIDNIRLENDMRLAVVLHKFNVNKDSNDPEKQRIMRIEFSVIYFPASLASLKQKSDPKDLLNRFKSE